MQKVVIIASCERMEGIQEIHHAVPYPDPMVQQNTELVVKSAAAAGALQSLTLFGGDTG